MDCTNMINNYIQMEKEILSGVDVQLINYIFNILDVARKNENTIFVCGNGGSAATASHFVCDFNNADFFKDGKKFCCICLNDNISMILATANDCGYDAIFERALTDRIKENDVLIAISGSGNSENVVKAIKYAKTKGSITVGFTGVDGGLVSEIVDANLNVAIKNMQISEDVHMIINHVLISCFKNKYANKESVVNEGIC